VRALLLTGVVGSGKTTVLLEAGRLLRDRAEPYALVDLDWLAWVDPAAESGMSVHDVLVANLRAVWPNFRAAGVTHVVLARHLRRVEEIDAIRRALGEAELAVVRLDAPRGVLEERIRSRDSGSELVEHLRELELGATQFDCPVVTSANTSPRETALAALAAAGW
jgi:hypothetical protein